VPHFHIGHFWLQRMRGTFGITMNTFRYCARSRVVLLGIAAYVVAMLLALALTPKPAATGGELTETTSGKAFDAERAAISSEGDRIRSIQSTSVSVAIFLGFAITALVAATWLPAQIRGGELTYVLSKPIGRVRALFGTLLGFWLLSAALFGVYALCGIGALRLAAATSGDRGESLRQLETIGANEADDFGLSGGAAAEEFVALSSTSQRAVWRYKGLAFGGRALEGGAVHCVFQGEIAKADNEFVTHTDLMVYLLDAGGAVVDEMRIANAKSGQVIEFTLPARYAAGGDFAIGVSPAVKGYKVFCYRRGLGVITSVTGFEWNYVKTFALAFIGLAVFAAVVVAGSTFLSQNVSIFFAMGVGIIGACMSFLREYSRVNPEFVERFEGRHIFLTHLRTGHDAFGESVTMTVTQTAGEILQTVVFGIVPDWGRFNGVDFALDRVNVPGPVFGDALLYAAIYCAACVVVGAFAFGRRELK